ncbi:hypothetical protein [Haladaptatus sp. DYF46]|uniref:hypothetical protein n=1 Tax=Haladaptatus sp. DYF46 TaxID=2886041 RepID=UPI001E32C777|nr:hypothetical protein [Haladaptatus sp. DYF46]
MSESNIDSLSIGDRVIDTEDDDPNEGIVIARPPKQTIQDWEFPTSEGPMTTADTNPKYPANTQLVIISFRSDLNDYWEDWRDTDPEDLLEGVEDNSVHRYGFPEPRLTPVVESESQLRQDEKSTDQEAILELYKPIIERLEQNEFTVEYEADTQALQVEKYGVEHTITRDGTVLGESGIKNRVESIVNRFL